MTDVEEVAKAVYAALEKKRRMTQEECDELTGEFKFSVRALGANNAKDKGLLPQHGFTDVSYSLHRSGSQELFMDPIIPMPTLQKLADWIDARLDKGERVLVPEALDFIAEEGYPGLITKLHHFYKHFPQFQSIGVFEGRAVVRSGQQAAVRPLTKKTKPKGAGANHAVPSQEQDDDDDSSSSSSSMWSSGSSFTPTDSLFGSSDADQDDEEDDDEEEAFSDLYYSGEEDEEEVEEDEEANGEAADGPIPPLGASAVPAENWQPLCFTLSQWLSSDDDDDEEEENEDVDVDEEGEEETATAEEEEESDDAEAGADPKLAALLLRVRQLLDQVDDARAHAILEKMQPELCAAAAAAAAGGEVGGGLYPRPPTATATAAKKKEKEESGARDAQRATRRPMTMDLKRCLAEWDESAEDTSCSDDSDAEEEDGDGEYDEYQVEKELPAAKVKKTEAAEATTAKAQQQMEAQAAKSNGKEQQTQADLEAGLHAQLLYRDAIAELNTALFLEELPLDVLESLELYVVRTMQEEEAAFAKNQKAIAEAHVQRIGARIDSLKEKKKRHEEREKRRAAAKAAAIKEAEEEESSSSSDDDDGHATQLVALPEGHPHLPLLKQYYPRMTQPHDDVYVPDGKPRLFINGKHPDLFLPVYHYSIELWQRRFPMLLISKAFDDFLFDISVETMDAFLELAAPIYFPFLAHYPHDVRADVCMFYTDIKLNADDIAKALDVTYCKYYGKPIDKSDKKSKPSEYPPPPATQAWRDCNFQKWEDVRQMTEEQRKAISAQHYVQKRNSFRRMFGVEPDPLMPM